VPLFTAYNFRNIEQIFTKFGINQSLFILNIMPEFICRHILCLRHGSFCQGNCGMCFGELHCPWSTDIPLVSTDTLYLLIVKLFLNMCLVPYYV